MKQVQKNSFVSYVLSDQVWWCNIKRCLSYFKNYICKFMQSNLWHHKLFHFQLPIWIWKVWKGRGKIQKFEHLENWGEEFCCEGFDLKVVQNGHHSLQLAKMAKIVFGQKVVKNNIMINQDLQSCHIKWRWWEH